MEVTIIMQKMLWTATSITLLDALKVEPTLLDDLDFGNEARTEKFNKIFKARYNTKSIAGETIELFKIYIDDTFNQYVDYYNELLDIYEEQLNYNDGIKATRIHRDTGDSQDTNNSHSENRIIDLPNSSTTGEYDSQKTKNETNSGLHNEYSKTISETVTGGVNVVDQRKKALEFIRNLYLEFADKFKDCFAFVYA